MRFSATRAMLPAAICALCATTANAAEPRFDFSAFGTLGFVYADTKDAEFVRDLQPTGSGGNLEFPVDSLAGAQTSFRMNDRFSATGQVMLRRRNQDDPKLDVTLAFLKGQVTDSTAVRVGRVQFPAFMVSDYRSVGYPNTWIRPPVEVYGQIPIDFIDGVDALFNRTFGGTAVSAQAFVGRYEENTNGTEVLVEPSVGVNVTVARGPVTARFGHVESDLTLHIAGLDGLFDTLRTIGYTGLADRLDVEKKKAVFDGLGVAVDWKNWIAQSEITVSRLDCFIADTTAWYTLVGHRFGPVTPYASYSAKQVDSARTDDTIPAVGPLAPLSAAVNGLIAGAEQHSTAVGMRWDFRDSMDIKVQYDRVHPEGAGAFANVQPGFSGPVNVFSLAVDFVF